MPDLLLELLSEEIPARMQTRAAEDLRKRVTDGLVEAGLTYDGAAAFSTPRRLALTVGGLTAESPSTVEERKGPRADAPDKAIDGFLRSTGLRRDQLELRDDKKGQVLFARIEKPGRKAEAIVAEVLDTTIRTFPWPKSMRWAGQDNPGRGELRWVRPLHSILCVLYDESGAAVVPFEIDGFTAGDTTIGHRFMAPSVFPVTSFDDYQSALKRGKVILDAAERAEHIWADATNQAFSQGLEVVEDRGLLAEVAGLVEWPVVLTGEIGADFLDLPPEVLQTSMREHQKFFSLRNAGTGRIERFATVANRETADQGATILAGNQKVLTARLSDAKFFWENDLRMVAKSGLEGMAAPLADVTFHNKLGSQAERVTRIEGLAREIAPMVGADPDEAAEAARICKADLASEMVYEFPELQGTMGRYYAAAGKHSDAVAQACEDHYAPLGPADDVPDAPASVAVALADKIDTLTGFWAIDEKPTGSKDPFALRRATLGVIRLILSNGLRLHLDRLFDAQGLRHRFGGEGVSGDLLGVVAKHGFHAELDEKVAEIGEPAAAWLSEARDSGIGDISNDLLGFFHDRLKVHLRDQDVANDVIDACLSMPNKDDLVLLVKRAQALAAFLKSEDGENLLQGFKRANNILKQAEEADGVEYSFGPDPKLAETDEERTLFAALDAQAGAISSAIEAEDFASAMASMASLRAPIDGFFEAVQVNSESQILRRNRLNLLHRIREACLQAADLTKIEG